VDEWIEIARREAGITSGSRQTPLTLVTTSYNPKIYAIKGILQPHGVATGWVPIGVIGAGQNFGVVIGPKAGDAKKLDGDQFSLEFENGDPNTPIARHRLSSSQDTPPQVETGEIAIVSQFNHNILLKKDGSLSIVTNDKDVAGKNQNSNPILAHSATSVQNNKTINHQVVLDPKGQKLTLFSTNGTVTHSTVHDLTKQTLTHSSVTGAAPGTPANPVAPSLTQGLPNLPGMPGLSGGTLSFQHIFDLLGGKLTHQATKGSLTHSTVFDTVANTLTHLVKQGGQSHSIVLDAVNGISQSTTAAHSRTAQTSITDSAPAISHNGNTSVTGNLGVSQILSAAQAAFGSHSFNIDPTGAFDATSGGAVSGGFSADVLTVSQAINLPVYTIAGLAGIVSPPLGAMVFVSDTTSLAAAAFNGIPTGGGSITVNRPATWIGSSWRY
jgi:hypothetical protein